MTPEQEAMLGRARESIEAARGEAVLRGRAQHGREGKMSLMSREPVQYGVP